MYVCVHTCVEKSFACMYRSADTSGYIAIVRQLAESAGEYTVTVKGRAGEQWMRILCTPSKLLDGHIWSVKSPIILHTCHVVYGANQQYLEVQAIIERASRYPWEPLIGNSYFAQNATLLPIMLLVFIMFCTTTYY